MHSNILFLCLCVKVDDADSSSLPPKACMECLRKLYSYGDFKQQTLCVDAKLRQIVHRKQKISEVTLFFVNLLPCNSFKKSLKHISLTF